MQQLCSIGFQMNTLGDHYLPYLAAFLQPKLRYLSLDKGMIFLNKLRQTYMLASLNTTEAHSKQNKDRYYDVP